MKENILSVIIQKPINEVFEFTTNPLNTPKWIDSVQVEEVNEWPAKIGSIYKNRGANDTWDAYKVSKYIKDEEFELIKDDQSTYHVNYSYIKLEKNVTKLIYHEWVTKGKIAEPFIQATLNRLKMLMEKNLSRKCNI